MTNTDRKDWTGGQGMALLLLCRLGLFFSHETPYSTAYALDVSMTALLQAALLLPLYFRNAPSAYQLPTWLARCQRAPCLLWCGYLVAQLYRLMDSLRAAKPPLLLLLLFGVLLYALTLPEVSAARAAGLTIALAGFAFLLLPITGFSTAHVLSLYTPVDTANLWGLEWAQSGELLLMPLLRQCQSPKAAKQSFCGWAIGKAVVIPLTIVFGAMQNGRLQNWEGNTFFLLLARTPLSDTFRMDGFWIWFAVGCAALAMVGILHRVKSVDRPSPFAVMGLLIPLAAVSGICILQPSALPVSLWHWLIPLFGIGIPWAAALYDRIHTCHERSAST